MRPTTYSDGMTQVSGGVPQLRRDPAQLPPLAGRPDVPGLVDRFGRVARDLACRCFFNEKIVCTI
jgi:hypothetical protein